MPQSLADQLRDLVRAEKSIYHAARATGVSQPTLQEFANGKADGTYRDMKLSVAQKLMDHYGLRVVAAKRSKESA
jgi:DNA-binding MurR/RpiR family transcriptional regulator